MSEVKSSAEVTPVVDDEAGAAATGGIAEEKREEERGGGGGGGRSRAKGEHTVEAAKGREVEREAEAWVEVERRERKGAQRGNARRG